MALALLTPVRHRPRSDCRGSCIRLFPPKKICTRNPRRMRVDCAEIRQRNYLIQFFCDRWLHLCCGYKSFICYNYMYVLLPGPLWQSIIQKRIPIAGPNLCFPPSQTYEGCLRTRLMNGTTRTRANQGVAHKLSPIRRGTRAFTTAHAVAILLGSG